MSRSFSKFGRIGFLIVACCSPQMFSFGDDGYPLPTPQVPTKTPPQVHVDCPKLGAVMAYEPTWNERNTFKVRVQFLNPTAASNCNSAVLYYSWPDTPTCDFNPGTGAITVTSTKSTVWSSGPIALNVSAISFTNWVRIPFTTVIPPGGAASADGTGKGIIIITQNDGSQWLVDKVITLEYVR